MGPAEPGAPGQPRSDMPLGSVDRETLDRSLVRGVAWTGSIKWIAQVASWDGKLENGDPLLLSRPATARIP